MSEQNSDHKSAPAAAPDIETAVLPVVEAPALSPATSETVAPVEASPVEVAVAEVAPVEASAAAEPVAKANATQRFRTAAAAHIAAARERLEQRNMSSVMTVALIASLAGASGTVVATSAIAHFSASADQRTIHAQTLQDSLARIEDEIAALRGKVERTADLNATQAAEAGERLERIEKAQADPAAKLGKLVEMVEKLRLANVALATEPAAAAANDVTGSIKPMPGAKAKFAKPAIVEGWTLLEIDRDAALLESKRGLFETSVGDTIPGVGRVEGFRKQDGRWVVVTPKGLIVAR